MTETRRETTKTTQEESEETNQSVKKKFQQFSPDNLPTLKGYLNDNETKQQILDQKMLSKQEKVIEITSQVSKSDDCSTNNYTRRPSEFHGQYASLKASTCEPANEIPSDDVSQHLHLNEDSNRDQKQAAKGPQTLIKITPELNNFGEPKNH